MPIGFIPQDETRGGDDVDPFSERWHASQIVEAMTLNKMIQDACEALFNRVRKYADQLECLDPFHQDAELAVGHVVLALSHDECAQDRLETLLRETVRLRLAVAKVRCGETTNAKSPPKPDRRGVRGQVLFLTLLWGAYFLFVLLIAGPPVQP